MPSRGDDNEGLDDQELAGRAAATKAVPHFTRAERAARGKAARAEIPRSSHAQIEFPPDRDPVALLEDADQNERNYRALHDAVDEGRIDAQTGL